MVETQPEARLAAEPDPRSRVNRHIRRWFDHYLAAAAVLALTYPLWSTARSFYGSGTDMVSLHQPIHEFAMTWMRQGVLPRWNPFMLGGVPFLVGTHGYLYPGQWTGLLVPVAADIKLGIVLHLMLAATGGVFLARGRTEHRLASCLTGVAFGLSAFLVVHLYAGHRVLVPTAAWLPWVLGLLDRSTRTGRFLLAAAAVTGLMVLCGHYQVIYIGAGGILVFLLLDRLFQPAEPGEATWRPRLLGSARVLGIWSMTMAVGALIAAVQVLPMIEMVGQSQRSEVSDTFAGSFGTAPINLATYVWPSLLGNRVDAPYIGSWTDYDVTYWEALSYIGLVPLAMAMFALFALPWRRSVPLAVVIVGATALAMGNQAPFIDWFTAVAPGADKFRAAGRYCLLATLFGSLLAGMGLDTWLRHGVHAPARKAGAIAVAAAAVVAVGFAVFVRTFEPTEWLAWLGRFEHIKSGDDTHESWPPFLAASAKSDTLKAALALAACAALLLVAARPNWRRWAALALVVIAAADLVHFGQRFWITKPIDRLEWPATLKEHLATFPPQTRIESAREVRSPNHGMVAGITSAGGYDTFLMRRYARYINRSQGQHPDAYISYVALTQYNRLVRHLGLELLVTFHEIEDGNSPTLQGFGRFLPYANHGNMRIYRDPHPVPRATLVHDAILVTDEAQVLQTMSSRDFDIRRLALVERDVPPMAPPTEPQRVGITRYEPNRVEIDVDASAPGLVVLSDNHHPDWRAEVNGKPTPVLRANYFMRAVPVPAGRSTIVMTFRSRYFMAGAGVSSITLIALAAGAFVRRRQHRSEGPAVVDA